MQDRKNVEQGITKKNKFDPPIYFLMCLLLTLGLHFVLPVRQLIYFPYTLIGIILLAIGIWLNIWTDNFFKQQNTTVKPFLKPSAFISEGPFRISRHPMYLGMVVALLGVVILLGSLTPFLAPIACFVTMQMVFIHYEERAMEETIGEEYIKYKNSVRCWL